MFMFVFAVILIAIVGLFLQLVLALGVFLAVSQTGVGQQLIVWQTMAYEYACSSPAIIAQPDAGSTLVPVATDITGMRLSSADSGNKPIYTGINWDTVIFRGGFIDPDTGTVSATTTRFVMSYADPARRHAGVSAAEVGRQAKKAASRHQTLPGVVELNGSDRRLAINMYTKDGALLTATVSGIPDAVPVGSSALITIADCFTP